MDPWIEITRLTGCPVLPNVKSCCFGAKLVTIPSGRVLYAAGKDGKKTMFWGAFEEMNEDWYSRGNQLDHDWYKQPGKAPVPIFEYHVNIIKQTLAVMSKVMDQPGVAPRIGPPKFQYYNPAGFGLPIKGRKLGIW
jgi:hypothetical protein